MSEPTLRCSMCGRPKPSETCTILRLTPKEMDAVSIIGEPPDQFVFCKACWKIQRNKERAAQLLKGLMQARMRARGSRSNLPDKLYRHLIDASAKGRVS